MNIFLSLCVLVLTLTLSYLCNSSYKMYQRKNIYFVPVTDFMTRYEII